MIRELSLQDAQKLGYKRVYFSFDCIGDTILFRTAIEHLSNQTKEKTLIGVHYKELLQGSKNIDLLSGFNSHSVNEKCINDILAHGIQPIFITAARFDETEPHFTRFKWGEQHILLNVCNKLGIDEKIDVRTEIRLTDPEKQYGRFFPSNSSQIAIMSTGVRGYKSLPYEKTQSIVDSLKHKYNFVQIGHIADPPLGGTLDKRDNGEIIQAASILYNSDLFVGSIGGMMHLARAVDTRSVIAYTAGEPGYLENYACNINVHPSSPSCTLCGNDNKIFPYQTDCVDTDRFNCVTSIDENEMISAIDIQMLKKGDPLEIEYIQTIPNPAVGMEDYIKRFGAVPKINAEIGIS